MAEYQRCRRVRPDIPWDTLFPDTHETRDVNGKTIVVVEDTPAATAIREAMTAAGIEDF